MPSFSLSPGILHVEKRIPETAEKASFGKFPIALQIRLGDDHRSSVPVDLEKADEMSPRQFPYELAGVAAFGKRVSLHAALPPGTFAQHALLRVGEIAGFSLASATTLITTAWETLMLLPPADLAGMFEGLVSGGYFFAGAAAVIHFTRSGLRHTETEWREHREFRSWKSAIKRLPGKLSAAQASLAEGIPDFQATLAATQAFRPMAPYLDRKRFFQPTDYRKTPPGPMRQEDVAFLREARGIDPLANPIPGPLPGEFMIDDVDTAWADFTAFAKARLGQILKRLETTADAETRFILNTEWGWYAELADEYARYAGRPAPWMTQ